jgi:hypothetical protein
LICKGRGGWVRSSVFNISIHYSCLLGRVYKKGLEDWKVCGWLGLGEEY